MGTLNDKSFLDYESRDEFRFRRGKPDAPKQMSGREVLMWLAILPVAAVASIALLIFLTLLLLLIVKW